MRRIRGLYAVALLGLTLGCGNKSDKHAPGISEQCAGMSYCVSSGNGIGASGGVHIAPNTPDAGAGGSSSMAPDAGPGTISGKVQIMGGSDLLQPQTLNFGKVEVSALGQNGHRITATYDGNADFSLDGLAVAGTLWVAVQQTTGATTQELITTLQSRDTTRGNSPELAIVDRTSLTDIVATGGAFLTPTELDTTKGHALIHFVTRDGAPVQQLEIVSTQTIAGAVVAYDAGVTYSDALTATDLKGAALLINMPANIFPGAGKPLTYRLNGRETSFNIDVARDAITIAEVVIN